LTVTGKGREMKKKKKKVNCIASWGPLKGANHINSEKVEMNASPKGGAGKDQKRKGMYLERKKNSHNHRDQTIVDKKSPFETDLNGQKEGVT